MTLQESLQNSQLKVEKRLGIIKKICKKAEIDFNQLIEDYQKEVNNDYDPYYLSNQRRQFILVKYINKIREHDDEIITQLSDNLYKLYEVERVYYNWKIKYDKELNKQNMEKIPSIWDFLGVWELKVIDWYKENARRYFRLNENEKEQFEKYKNSSYYQRDLERCSYKWDKEHWVKQSWKRNYYSQIDNFTKEITHIENECREISPYNYQYHPISYHINEELLNKEIGKEKLNKYIDLINRVTKYIGEIKDSKYLSVSPQGELNGIIEGANGKVKIETISAGGYNVQCFHYRVLIHKI